MKVSFPAVLEYSMNHCWDEEQESSNDYGIMTILPEVVVIPPPHPSFLLHCTFDP